MIGYQPGMDDGLAACRFMGFQAGSAVFRHRLETCVLGDPPVLFS